MPGATRVGIELLEQGRQTEADGIVDRVADLGPVQGDQPHGAMSLDPDHLGACGLLNHLGRWMRHVGLPAASWRVRSQVPGRTPIWRSSFFCTFSVGVRGSDAITS